MNNDDSDSLVYITCAINATLLSPTFAGVRVCWVFFFFNFENLKMVISSISLLFVVLSIVQSCLGGCITTPLQHDVTGNGYVN